MSHNPIQKLSGVNERSLNWLAGQCDVYDLLDDEDDRHDDEMLAIGQELAEALGLIGPYIMDDTMKWNGIQQIIAAWVLLDRHSDLDRSARLPTEQCDGTGGDGGRGPHYDPMNEIDQLDEPTVEALGERYHVNDAIEYTPDENLQLVLQQHLGQALLELNGTRFPTNYEAGQSILAAMVRVDRTFDGRTKLKLEDVVDSFRMPPKEGEDEGELVEYDTQALTTSVITRGTA